MFVSLLICLRTNGVSNFLLLLTQYLVLSDGDDGQYKIDVFLVVVYFN